MNRRQALAKLDRVFSRHMRLKDADLNGTVVCCTCGKLMDWQESDAGHYVKRQHYAVRYDPRNVHAQCTRCNRFLDGNQDEYALYIVRRYGLDVLTQLGALKREVKKWTTPELLVLIEHHSEQAKRLECALNRG